MQITALFILEVINIAITLLFLTLFSCRLRYLSHFSQTDQYLNYYPKLRILFAIVYIALSVGLLTFNIVRNQYPNQGEKYLFAGGGGETINALILVLQLVVLRQQLKKQRPYTGTHLIYFTYLLIISLVRFGLTLAFLIENKGSQFVDLIISTSLMIDTCFQLGYWIAKKQTMPEFQSNNYFSFDQFRMISNRVLSSNKKLQQNIFEKSIEQNFPYIKSTVKIQSTKFKIILQTLVSNRVLPLNLQQTGISNKQDRKSMKIHRISQQMRNSQSKQSSNSMNKKWGYYSTHLQIISQNHFNLQQIKQLYLLCGRFTTIENQIIFLDRPLREIAQNLHIYLIELFSKKKHYQQFLLKYLNLDQEFIEIYKQKLNKINNLEPNEAAIKQSGKYDYSSSPFSTHRNFKLSEDSPMSIEQDYINRQQILRKKSQAISSLSQNVQSPIDKNSIYLSIQIYKNLWIDTYYVFYIKIVLKQDTNKIAYSTKRYSDFEDLNQKILTILNSRKYKLQEKKTFKIPQLPKKHLFHWDKQKIKQRRIQLQLYLRKICNDQSLMKIPQVNQTILKFLNFSHQIISLTPVYEDQFYQDLKVIKGNISKALVDNDYITYYEFKLYRHGIQIRTVHKRFNDFLLLHQDIQRWMNNNQIFYTNVQLPEKHLYKNQVSRHQKLRNYLQNVIRIKDSFKIYPLNVFFNISGNNQLSDDTIYSAISFVKSKGKQMSSPKYSGQSYYDHFELNQKQAQDLPELSQNSSDRRMSELIDQLRIQ